MGLKKRAKGAFEKLVPISPEFYDTERDEDLIAEKNVLLPFNAFLLFSQWAAFIALMVYYSGPANYVTTTRMELDYHYGYPAYNCTPIVADEAWGNYFNYDTCKALSARPTKGTNVKTATVTQSYALIPDFSSTVTGYVYYPFPHLGTGVDGLAGLHEKTHSPSLYSSKAAARAAHSEKAAKMMTLNSCGSDAGYIQKFDNATVIFQGDEPWVIPSTSQAVWKEDTSVQMTGTEGACVDYGSTIGSAVGLNDLYAADSCYFNHSWPMLQNVMNMLGEDEWQSPGHVTQAGLLEDLAKYQVSLEYKRSLSMCTITEDEAVNMFQEYYDDGLCTYAKANMPFTCTKEAPPSIPQRFSLAYANSLLLYTVFSTICVKIFFASRKEPNDEVTESEEKSTRV